MSYLLKKKNSKPEPLNKQTNKQTNTPGTAINSEVIEVRRRSRRAGKRMEVGRVRVSETGLTQESFRSGHNRIQNLKRRIRKLEQR